MKYDLSLNIDIHSSRLDIAIDFWRSHISQESVEAVAASFEKALLSVVDEKTGNLAQISVVPTSDVERIRTLNHHMPANVQARMQDRVYERQCAQPDAWAVQGWDGDLTYRQLEQTTNKLAWYLNQRGIRPEIKLPLCFDKSKWAVISQLAVLKAGGCVVPIGAKQPVQRLEMILNDIEAPLVLTTVQHANLFEGFSLEVVIVDDALVSALPDCDAPVCAATPDNTAFIIYTSGSTGIPKGVVLPHSSLCSSLKYLGEKFELGPDTRTVQFSAYTFDISIQDIYTTWHFGGCLCIIPEEDRLDNLGAAMRFYQVNFAGLTSTIAGLLSVDEVPELKTLVLLGEAVQPAVAERWWNHVKVFNAYGPSECSMQASCNQLLPGCDALNIGFALAGALWVVEAQDYNRLVPMGAPGELLIEGPLQARGYLNDPIKTAAAFVTDPKWVLQYGLGSGRRFYRTGDLVQQNDDMSVTYIGRRDTQIKVRGQRVEIGETEHHLLQHEAVLDAAVLYPRRGPCADRLVGLVTLHDLVSDQRPGLALTPVPSDGLPLAKQQVSTISEHVAKWVPEHMVPSIWIPITTRMPQNDSSKLDRKKLTQWVEGVDQGVVDSITAVSPSAGRSRDPETERERLIQHAWADAMKQPVTQMPVEGCSFLAAGGDSMTAMQVVARLRSAGVNVPMRDVLESKSIAQLAIVPEEAHQPSKKDDTIGYKPQHSFESLLGELQNHILPEAGVRPDQVEDIYSCSPIQEGILMSQLKSPSQYYIQQSVEIKSGSSSVNVNRLKEAWQELVNRHPMLRTIFVVSPKVDNTPFVQVALKSAKANIEQIFCENEEVDAHLAIKTGIDGADFENHLSHQFTVCSTTSGRVYARMIISHALIDASSLIMLQKELAEVYDRPPSRTTVPSYSDYVSYLQETSADEGIKYWTQRLANAQPCYLPASTTSEPSSQKKESIASQDVSIEMDGMAELQRFSKRHGVTIANMFQLAWAMVLSTFTGSPNVSFGYLSSGRDVAIKGVDEMVGPMINMMVTHLTLDPTMSVINAVRQAQDAFLTGFHYQRVPLPKIWHELQLQGQSLFNTVLSYRAALYRDHENSSLIFEHIRGEDRTEYDVSVSIFASSDRTTLLLQYSPDFIDSEMATRLVQCLQQTVKALAANPNQPMDQISMVTSDDIKQLSCWEQETARVDEKRCIQDVVHEHRLLHPNAAAVCAWDGRLTYEELDQKSDQLAQYLRSSGVGPEVMVPLCFDKSVWAIVSQLSVMKAGGMVVSVNPQHPNERLQGILDDVGARIMLTTPRYSDRFLAILPQVVEVGPGFYDNLPEGLEEAISTVRPENAAFIIYTSGSTGKPKGVVLTHSAVCASLQAHGKAYGMNSDTRSVQFASYTFDASISDIWGTLSHGGCVCVISEEDRMNKLQAAINSYEVNLAQLTPTVAGLLDFSKLPSLRTIVLGGEPVKEVMVEQLHASNSQLTVMNGYGPTECSIYTTANVLRDPAQAPNIGRPLLGGVWLVSQEASPCPIGAVGEIWIEGALLARGYLNDQQKTDKSFIKDPVWTRKIPGLRGRRFYRTGDLARQTPNGQFIHLGRKDTQIKIRGQRVEVGEIEYHVKKYLPSVKDVVVLLVVPKGTGRSPMMAAVMEVDNHLPADSTANQILIPGSADFRNVFCQLRDALANSLPVYMVPRLFVPALRLPQTASGKLERRYLRQLLEDLPDEHLFQYSLDDAVKVMPVTETEKQLQQLWAQVLGVNIDRVGLYDHFLHVGGDSVTAMRLVANAHGDGVPLTVSDVFQYPKLQDMAARIYEQKSLRPQTDNVPQFSLFKEEQDFSSRDDGLAHSLEGFAKQCGIDAGNIEDVYPCTPLQEALMAITAQNPGAYVGQWVYQIAASVDIDRLKQSWRQLVQRLPVLRTRILPGYRSGALQVVVRDDSVCDEENNINIYMTKEVPQSICYGKPIVRAAIITAVADRCYFILTAHHSAYDGASLVKTINALSQIYTSSEIPTPPPYTRFVRYLQQQDSAAAGSFWRSQLDGDMGVPFPYLPEPSYQPCPTQLIACHLETTSVSSTVTLASILRATWSLIVSSYTGGNVFFGQVLSGRAAPVPEILDMLAPTITTVPIRIAINKADSVADYLSAIQQQTIDMLPFEHTGLQHIRRLVQKDLTPPHLFTILPSDERNVVDNSILMLEDGSKSAQVIDNIALAIQCVTDVTTNGVDIEARFDKKVLSAMQVQRLLDRFRHIFPQLVQMAKSDKSIGEVDIVSPEEVGQLAKWNRNCPPLQPILVHEAVSRYASTQPGAPAVCSWDGDLSYLEMDQLAEKLAHHLVSLGISPEVNVGLCFDKSKWAIVSIFAILKAGGAVVPLRPEQTQRGQTILDNTGINIVLTCSRPDAQFSGNVQHTLIVDKALLASLSQFSQRVAQPVNSSNIAFIYHTSGSTGVPKGVVLEHSTIATSIDAQGEKLGMNNGSRSYQFSNLTFDMSLHDILAALQFGGCICLPSEEEKLSNLAGAINRMKVNKICLPPRVLHTIKPSDVPCVSTIIVGGEAVQGEQIAPWLCAARVFNGYGPTECAMISTRHRIVDPTDASTIGTAIAGTLWVVDEHDTNQLLPIGASGELLIGGPQLARGYLRQSSKTATAFINHPAWMKRYGLSSGDANEGRLYRTGDIVRQRDDGSLVYIGRADSQVKIRGQRAEIGEIEHYLVQHNAVSDGIALFPRSGLSKSRLVGVVVLRDFKSASNNGNIQPTRPELLPKAMNQASAIRQYMLACLPDYMVPDVWISLASMPQSTSYKADRPRLMNWLESMDKESFDAITRAVVEDVPQMPKSELEQQLQKVCAIVLHLPLARVEMNRSFLNLGGDSITAMQLVSHWATYGITVVVKDVLQSRSLAELAQKAVAARATVQGTAVSEAPFALGPIQRQYFESFAAKDLNVTGENRFNQSACLEINGPISVRKLQEASERLVERHAMLRSRFFRAPDEWRQRIVPFYPDVFEFAVHTVANKAEAEEVILLAEGKLNLEQGPVFAVHWIDIASSDTPLFFLTAHHLVIDIVSWHIIIRDLESFIRCSTTPSITTSFQHWTSLLLDHSQYYTMATALPSSSPVMDWSYWGLTPHDNLYGDRTGEKFILDEEHTSLLFHEHQPLRTEPVEVMIAALIHSFRQVFPDRSVPSVFNEGHGREPWDDSIDLSSTVGWFTNLVPIHLTVDSDDLVDILRRTKDTRRRIPERGLAFFATRWLTAAGRASLPSHQHPEVTFNYTGREMQTKDTESLFTLLENRNPSGIGKAVKRPSVFEIEASARHGRMHIGFHYNKQMRRQDAVRLWARQYLVSLKQLLGRLAKSPSTYTLSDFPQTNMTDGDFSLLQNTYLSKTDIKSLSEVENIYPCSPIQQGILISQIKEPRHYHVQQVGEIVSQQHGVINVDRLAAAWQTVVSRHAILRTIFFASTSGRDLFYQIVRTRWTPQIPRLSCSTPSDVLLAFSQMGSPAYGDGQPQHRLSLCETSTKQVFVQLETNHALMDATSVTIILQNLFQAYREGSGMGIAPSYGEYVLFLQRNPAERSLSYWTERLSGASPCYFPPSPSKKLAPRVLKHVAEDFKNIDRLHAFRDLHGVTIASIVQLSWGIVLARYTQSSDVVFGCLTNGRDAPIPGIDTMVGPMINMTVSRMQLEDRNLTVAQTVQKVQEDFFEAFDHQRTSLGNIQHALQLSDKGLFNTTVSYKREAMENPASQSSLAIKAVSATDPTEYDLNIDVTSGEHRMRLSLQYASDFLDDDAAQRLIGGLQTVLLSVLENANAPVSEIEVFPPSDVESLRLWNSGIPSTVDTLVHDEISKHGIVRPAALAVCGWDGQLTYEQLNGQADRLTQHLTALGVRGEAMVGLCFDKSVWTSVAMLAVARAGGVIVPLGVQLPLQRLETILNDSQPNIVLTDNSNSAKFLTLQIPHILTVDSSSLAKLAPVSRPLSRPTLNAASAVVVIYTSGSTGIPKGVVLTHGSLSTSIEYHASILNVGPQTRALQFSAYVFDLSLLDIFTVLRFGGCVCVVSEEDRMDSKRLSLAMERMNVNFAVLTPTVAALLQPCDVPSLHSLVLAGEKLPPAVIETWSPHVTVFNGYGPAECTILSTINGPLTDKDRSTNVGWPVAGGLWVVDPRNYNSLVPIGAVGELMIEGPLVAREYLHNPERTADSFLLDPAFLSRHGFRSQDGQRMYRTGDLVQQDPVNGSITYIGRADDQVKVRGQRVELGEIEYWVQQHCIRSQNTAAILFEPQGAGTDIILAVAIEFPDQDAEDPSANTSASPLLSMADSVRSSLLNLPAALNQSLPSFMIPSFYVPVKQIPLTTSGKLDRKTLGTLLRSLRPDQLAQYSLSEAAYVEPSSSTECKLCNVWCAVLPNPGNVSARAHFFRCGGDSVRAMRFVGLANQLQPPLPLTVADIFQHPVLSEMAKTVEQRLSLSTVAAGTADPEPLTLWSGPTDIQRPHGLTILAKECNVTVEDIEDVYPCTPLQEGLMAITSRQPQAYIARWVFQLDQAIDIKKLENSWKRLWDLASILRTRLIQDDKAGILQVSVWHKMPWTHVNSNLEAFLADDTTRGMGFGTHLARFTIVNDNSERYLVWTAHHAIYDGWTTQKLLQTASKIYQGDSAPDFSPYTRFIRYLQNRSTADAANFWRLQLEGAGQSHSFPAVPKNYSPGTSGSLTRRITTHSGAEDITTATLLRSAWALVLSQETSSQHVVFPTIMSGRSAPVPGVLDMIGPTITTVPVHIYLDREQGLDDYLRMVQKQSTDMIPFEHTGLQNIRVITSDLPSAFQHLFVVQSSSDQLDQVFPGLQLLPCETAEFYGYPLVVMCTPLAEGQNSNIELQVRFDETLLSMEKMQSLLDLFEHIFGQLRAAGTASANRKIGGINLVTPRDIRRLQEWNNCNSPVIYRANSCVHELFHQQVTSRSDAPAVAAWDRNLSYQQLDQLATRLAHYLVSLGVGPEIPVGMMFEKSAWAVVSELAILKAGGIVVPVNPQHPEQRNQAILETTNTSILLSSDSKHPFHGRVRHFLVVDQHLLDAFPELESPACQDVTSDNAAFIIFTSGSTGIPKGVVLQHGALVSSLQAHGALYASPATRTFQFASYSFDASISEIFTTLAFGGCVCIPSEQDRMNRLAGAIQDFAATFAMLTPTVASLLKPEEVPSLESILMIGESLKPEAVLPWLNSPIQIFNGYGPTEYSILTTFSPRITSTKQVSTLGTVLTGSTWIVDALDYHQLLPVGTVGELLIEGPLLARGYLNDDDKTRASFVTDPAWSHIPELGGRLGRRFYRTGDLVRQNPDGSLVYSARRDTQVKINGQRVEIAEVEHWVKTSLPHIHEVVAGLVDTEAGTILAVATELSKEPSSTLLLPLSDKIRQSFVYLRSELMGVLPGYMVPQIYLPCSRMPVTDSGKLDRRATWAAIQQSDSLSQYFLNDGSNKISPSTPTEFRLRELWAAVLKIPAGSIAANDDFFHSGADSISAMRLATKARTDGPFSLQVKDIFRSPILSHMAAVVDQNYTTPPAIPSEPYKPFSALRVSGSLGPLFSSLGTEISPEVPIVDVAPTTDVQALFVVSSLRKSRDALAHVSIDGDGMPNISRWKNSCLELIKGHEILRTAYVFEQDRLLQVVLKEYQPEIPIFNTGSVPIDEFSKNLIAQDMHCTPRLGQPFVQFAIVLSKRDDQHRIILRLSHGEYDQIALSHIIRTLQAIYNQQSVPELTPFAHYVSNIANANKDESYAYWRSLLQGSSMPVISARSNVHLSPRPGKLVPCETKKLDVNPGSLPSGITISTVVHASWALVLARFAGNPDVVYGDVISGRNSIDNAQAEKIVGCCVNVIPVRAKIENGRTILDFFTALQDQLISRLPHATLGYREILRSCTNMPSSTFFSSRLNHLSEAPQWLLKMGSVDYRVSLAFPDGAQDLPAVSITSISYAGHLTIAFGYREDLISSQVADSLFNQLFSTIDLLLHGIRHDSPLDAVISLSSSCNGGDGDVVGDSAGNTSAFTFEGDLIDASYTAFSQSKNGMHVSIDDV